MPSYCGPTITQKAIHIRERIEKTVGTILSMADDAGVPADYEIIGLSAEVVVDFGCGCASKIKVLPGEYSKSIEYFNLMKDKHLKSNKES